MKSMASPATHTVHPQSHNSWRERSWTSSEYQQMDNNNHWTAATYTEDKIQEELQFPAS